LGRATIGKTVFICAYSEKKSLNIIVFRTSKSISIKLGTNHSCMKQIKFYESKCSNKWQIPAKIGWGHLKSSQEPLSQKSTDLRESFLTY
jgi:hypothetical protein